ncbi:MAG TPA: bifunctional demethylmenaquinone methyltransferase/2-methoxy-6-polyprenyl-1,4-benzoquinol methylase UbiE [Ignavibacteriales bacterium]|nr:bifunctional demethylmenaquinone methyltransferase/2-methoxy-6-polyprenyl-1,4-benzoquinol methylase UbiE [Ignavibacteriales bacterium]
MNKKTQVRNMFDSIAYRYDLLNHLLSAGIDVYWRKRSLKMTGITSEAVLLDVACGTGDYAITARKMGVKKIFGADLSFQMLKFFNTKTHWSRGNTMEMVAEMPPIKDESITNITVGFGVRNFYDIQKSFDSFYRILKPGGKATILEFRLPSNPLIKMVYQFYFRKILPFIGGLISKDKAAYTYLPESVQEFDKKVNLPELFRNSGFRKVEKHSLTFGIVQVVIAAK